jgi:hypothetical protein
MVPDATGQPRIPRQTTDPGDAQRARQPPRRTAEPDRRDPRQRPARVWHLPDRSNIRAGSPHRSAATQPDRPADRRDHVVRRPRTAGGIRAPQRPLSTRAGVRRAVTHNRRPGVPQRGAPNAQLPAQLPHTHRLPIHPRHPGRVERVPRQSAPIWKTLATRSSAARQSATPAPTPSSAATP